MDRNCLREERGHKTGVCSSIGCGDLDRTVATGMRCLLRLGFDLAAVAPGGSLSPRYWIDLEIGSLQRSSFRGLQMCF